MLLRITKRPSGTFDGLPLDHHQVGGIYEVGPQLCGVLLLGGWAELAEERLSEIPVLLLTGDDSHLAMAGRPRTKASAARTPP